MSPEYLPRTAHWFPGNQLSYQSPNDGDSGEVLELRPAGNNRLAYGCPKRVPLQ